MEINLKVNIGDRVFIIPKAETTETGFAFRFFEVEEDSIPSDKLVLMRDICHEDAEKILQCLIGGECPSFLMPYLEI